MGVVVEQGPATEPVTVERARDERGLAHNLDDSMLEAKITEAREHIEIVLGKALITQTWSLYLHEFPDVIELPGGRVQSITSITYKDADGVDQTLVASDYDADLFSRQPIIRPADKWPDTADQLNAVKVEYVVGYGDADAVPGGIKAALLLMVGDAYENREGQIAGETISENKAVSRLLWPHRAIGA